MIIKKYLFVFFLLSCFFNSYNLFTMEDKDKPLTLYNVIKDNTYKRYTNIKRKVEIIVAETVKNRGGLVELWQTSFENTSVNQVLHKLDSLAYIQVDVTAATIKLKKHFKYQIQSKTIRQIIRRELRPTGLYLIPEPSINDFLYKSLYGLALISTGWIGKSLWDAGGKKYTMLWGNYLFQQLVKCLEDLDLNSIFLQKL